MNKGFWNKLTKPVVGLSPMDGVTDAPMRYVAKKYGQPDVIYTEFVSAEGLWRLKKRGEMENKIWKDLRYDESERPVVAQLFGSDPDSFYEASKIITELGFDGIDINMGCPSPGLERRGGGAGLMRDPGKAGEVVEATRRGVSESGSDIPVSLKTRLGSREPDREWWKFVASLEMPAVAMHGRTFKQLYAGEADWDLLLEASEVIRESGALFLGNGDIERLRVVSENEWGVDLKSELRLDLGGKMDGVLIGREAIGNPWVLNKDVVEVSVQERLGVVVEHAKLYERMFPEGKFFPMRKHLVKYVQGFEGAAELRKKLVLTNSSVEVKKTVEEFLD